MKLIIKVSVRWWIFYPYKAGVIFFAKMMGVEPDWDKVSQFVGKYCIKVSNKCI